MDDVGASRERLFRQLDQAIAGDPLRTIPTLVALRRETDERLREAVRQATPTSSWREIAAGLGVSKQAAHHRFKAYADEAAAEIKSEHRAMKRARRAGDAAQAATSKERRDEMIADLRSAAEQLKRSV